MWAYFKIVGFFKLGSTVQKLFDVEIRRPAPLLQRTMLKEEIFNIE